MKSWQANSIRHHQPGPIKSTQGKWMKSWLKPLLQNGRLLINNISSYHWILSLIDHMLTILSTCLWDLIRKVAPVQANPIRHHQPGPIKPTQGKWMKSWQANPIRHHQPGPIKPTQGKWMKSWLKPLLQNRRLLISNISSLHWNWGLMVHSSF